MKYTLRTYSIWECGKRMDAEGKPHQEDSLFPPHGEARDTDRLFILCDGMGGHDAGEVASATVCETMGKSILSAAPDSEGNFNGEIFHKALNDAFVALDAKDSGTSVKKMGTTMTLLKLHSEGCLIAHMGDSRVYHIRPGKTAKETRILFRTEDHSLVNELVKAGELTPEEARLSPRKNVITRAMQPHMEQSPKADTHSTDDIQPGDYFYLCSDGMLENMEDGQLRHFFSQEAGNDQRKVESLLKATQENRDNHSAILVHILDVIGGSPSHAANHTKQRKRRGGLWILALIVACVAVLAVWHTHYKSAPKPEAPQVRKAERETDRPVISKPVKSNAPTTVKEEGVEEKGTNATKILEAATNLINKDSANSLNSTNTEPDKTQAPSSEVSEPSIENNEEDNTSSEVQDINNDNVTENN